ncbi:MAG TPA: plastocyanin/azurin family copper-binding protein [Anaerolineaceae bacterium]|jgi:plastocyanin
MKFVRKVFPFANLALAGILIVMLPLAVTLFFPLMQDQGSSQTTTAATVDVQVGANMTTFTPQTVTIHVGDTVRWTWVSDTHTVTSGSALGAADGKFCSPSDSNCSTPVASNTGTVYQHTFTQAGTYPYFCAFHVAAGMTGEVVVLP